MPLFSDLCFFTHVFGNSLFHSGILELPPKEYSWRNWLPHCRFAERNRAHPTTGSFLHHGHNTIHISISRQSFAKIQPNNKRKCNYMFSIYTNIKFNSWTHGIF